MKKLHILDFEGNEYYIPILVLQQYFFFVDIVLVRNGDHVLVPCHISILSSIYIHPFFSSKFSTDNTFLKSKCNLF